MKAFHIMTIAGYNVIKFSSVARHLFERKSVNWFENYDHFIISAISMKLIDNILYYFRILLNMLSSATELLKADEDESREYITFRHLCSMHFFPH